MILTPPKEQDAMPYLVIFLKNRSTSASRTSSLLLRTEPRICPRSSGVEALMKEDGLRKLYPR